MALPHDEMKGSLLPHDSITTPLGIDGSWTSKVDDDLRTGRIVGSVYANVAGTIYVEQSADKSNWDAVESWAVSAGVGLGFSVEKVAQYIRVRYVNGGVAQTTFRLYSYRRMRVR